MIHFVNIIVLYLVDGNGIHLLPRFLHILFVQTSDATRYGYVSQECMYNLPLLKMSVC